MAKSGFVPAWMKIPSADKTSGNQKLTLDRSETNSTSSSSSPPFLTGRQRHHSSEQFDHSTTRQSPFFFYKTLGRQKPDEQIFDDDLFSYPSRRSYSRERSSNTFVKSNEINSNGFRSLNPSQRRLHSMSSYPHEQSLPQTRTNESNFDRLEQDFPSLNGREKHTSSSHDQSSSVWTNAATKFRTSHNEPFKLLDRTLGSNRILTRRDRLLTTPNGFHHSSSSPSTNNNSHRSITLDLQTNYKTQTKNLDKRSDFLNSLKNDSINEENKRPLTKINSNSTGNYQITKGTLLLLSVSETPEEKELLIQMGWKDGDERTYEITDQDKEEYEKRIQHVHKNDQNSAALMSALHRRTLPCIDLRDLLRSEMHSSNSDDESSDE